MEQADAAAQTAIRPALRQQDTLFVAVRKTAVQETVADATEMSRDARAGTRWRLFAAQVARPIRSVAGSASALRPSKTGKQSIFRFRPAGSETAGSTRPRGTFKPRLHLHTAVQQQDKFRQISYFCHA